MNRLKIILLGNDKNRKKIQSFQRTFRRKCGKEFCTALKKNDFCANQFPGSYEKALEKTS
jgi:hypothetical protein